jgi:hypothetical protein
MLRKWKSCLKRSIDTIPTALLSIEESYQDPLIGLEICLDQQPIDESSCVNSLFLDDYMDNKDYLKSIVQDIQNDRNQFYVKGPNYMTLLQVKIDCLDSTIWSFSPPKIMRGYNSCWQK